MAGSVSLVDGHIDYDEKAECSKCIVECRKKDWFEHQMQVEKYGCCFFKSRSDSE